MKIYGPYVSKQDGRSRCVIVNDDGSKTTVSYPRMLVEAYIGNSLEAHEDVHHIDEDVTNNDISNLEVVFKAAHIREHSLKYRTDVTSSCIYCGIELTLNHDRQSQRFRDANRGKAGPFCSKSCIGKYGADKQRAAK